jgi:hypothetical protein
MSEQGQKYWSDEEVINYLKKLRVAIDEGLTNLGEDPADVTGFAFEAFQVSAPSASPALLARLGPSFVPTVPGGLGADNGHCGIICGPDPTQLGGGIFE